MHGMVNRAFQGFVTTTYGPEVWKEICGQAGLSFHEFEAMLRYDDAQTMACFATACDVLHKHPNTLLDDLGTWLVTDASLEPLRRLLRFGGSTFVEFVQSLEEIGDRGRLAMPNLEMPQIEVLRTGPGRFRLRASWRLPGIGPIILGALRAMADDYGALAFLNLSGIEDGTECLDIQLLDSDFAEGRDFSLGGMRA